MIRCISIHFTVKIVVANEFSDDSKTGGNETVGVLIGNTNEKWYGPNNSYNSYNGNGKGIRTLREIP